MTEPARERGLLPEGFRVLAQRTFVAVVSAAIQDLGAMRFLLDTNVFDLLHASDLIDTANAVQDRGVCEFCVGSVQEDQLAAVPDPEKRAAFARLKVTHVDSGTANWGFDWGDVDWGADGGDGVTMDSVRGDATSDQHIADDEIAVTAALHGLVLVSCDRRLLRVFAGNAETLAAWHGSQLVDWLRAMIRPGAHP